MLLTLRTDHLTSHAGQVAFPGGKIDEDDGDAVAAALREAEEETGLAAGSVEPLGFLDGYLTRTAFQSCRSWRWCGPASRSMPHADEVAAVFEVPLRFLMSAENHRATAANGRARRVFLCHALGERYIWGATAGMIKNLYDRLYG